MNFNDAGLKLLMEFEGCSLVAYEDQGGRWTIGYGHAMNVKPGDTLTADEAKNLLLSDAADRAEQVKKLVKYNLNDNQFSAVVCFAYNVGCGNLAQSTLLNCINTSHLDDAANEFLRWDKVKGVEVPGLLRRRQAERDLFTLAVPSLI